MHYTFYPANWYVVFHFCIRKITVNKNGHNLPLRPLIIDNNLC